MEFYKIGKKIKELRKERGLTQEALASNCGTTRQTLSKLEKGNIDKVSLQLFIKVLEALEYELEIEEKKPFYYFDASKL